MFWLMASTEVGDIRAGRTTILGPEGGWGATNSLGLTSSWCTLAEIVFKTSTTGINMSDLELPCKIWNHLGTSMGCLVWALWTRRQLSWIRILHQSASYCNCSDMIRYRQMMSDLYRSVRYLFAEEPGHIWFRCLGQWPPGTRPLWRPGATVQRCTLQSGKAARENVKPLRLTADMSIGRSGSGETLDLLSIQLQWRGISGIYRISGYIWQVLRDQRKQ